METLQETAVQLLLGLPRSITLLETQDQDRMDQTVPMDRTDPMVRTVQTVPMDRMDPMDPMDQTEAQAQEETMMVHVMTVTKDLQLPLLTLER